MAGVVVGVGRHGSSQPAVRWAGDEAVLHGLALTLVHAWDEPLDVSIDLEPASLPEVTGPATSCAVHGRAAAVLLTQQPDLLVLGGHEGARHVPHLTRDCMHHAACPVVVVPDSEPAPTSRVVVGICGTAASSIALRWAAHEARLRGAELVIVHAWQVHPASARDVLRPARAIPAQQEAARTRLSSWVRAELGPQDHELHTPHGGPLDGLLAAARNADLMVLGRSAHSRFDALLHGSLGDQLSGLAPCPVAIIPGQHTPMPAML